MEEDIRMNSPVLIEAFRVWSGRGVSSWPARSEARLRLHFYQTDAWRREVDLAEMANIASAHFKLLHPEVAEEIVEILAWCYSYDYK